MKVISKVRSEWCRWSVPGEVSSMCKGPETKGGGKSQPAVTVQVIAQPEFPPLPFHVGGMNFPATPMFISATRRALARYDGSRSLIWLGELCSADPPREEPLWPPEGKLMKQKGDQRATWSQTQATHSLEQSHSATPSLHQPHPAYISHTLANMPTHAWA